MRLDNIAVIILAVVKTAAVTHFVVAPVIVIAIRQSMFIVPVINSSAND